MDTECILKNLDTLYHACISEGGDGDVLWYCTNHPIEAVYALATIYNSTLKFPFNIELISDKTIHWGDNQEWITITSDKALYDNTSKRNPSWLTFIFES